MNQSLDLFTAAKQSITFPELLDKAQQYMSVNYPKLLEEKRSKQKQEQMLSNLRKFILDNSYSVASMESEDLPFFLYDEMVEFSFLTPYLNGANTDWEEININRWDDTKIHFCDGTVRRSPRQFFSPDHAEGIIKRLLRYSGIVFDQAKPLVRGHLKKTIRCTVEGCPVIDNDAGISVSIRNVNPKKLSKLQFIQNGTATEKMLDTIAALYRYGTSMCLAGPTGSGKTTIMSWILSTLPYWKRIYTIENTTREFDLVVRDEDGHVLNNVIHTVTHDSDDPKQCITEQMLLEQGLTFDPDYICMAETKGIEAYQTQEAARTGHAVITTTHTDTCADIYDRLLDLCSLQGNLNGELLKISIARAFPITFVTKKMEDNVRRITEICECELTDDGKRVMHTLYQFHTERNHIENGKVIIDGYFEKVENISERLQQKLRNNGIPEEVLKKITGGDAA